MKADGKLEESARRYSDTCRSRKASSLVAICRCSANNNSDSTCRRGCVLAPPVSPIGLSVNAAVARLSRRTILILTFAFDYELFVNFVPLQLCWTTLNILIFIFSFNIETTLKLCCEVTKTVNLISAYYLRIIRWWWIRHTLENICWDSKCCTRLL